MQWAGVLGEAEQMASVDEIVTALQTAIDKLGESITATSSAESDTSDLAAQMAGLGVQDKATEFAAVKDAIEKARVHLAGGSGLLDEAMNLVRAAGG
jgi:hypothetical protein